MKKIEGFDKIEVAGEIKKLPAGPYICKITDVVDKPDSEYLEVYFDICNGEFKGYFEKIEKATSKKLGREIRSYKEKALPFFKAFITAVEKSNPNYVWNWDEKTLVNKYVVVNFGEEEYLDDDYEIKVAMRAQEFRSGEKFRNGEIKVLPLKKLSEEDLKKYQEHQNNLSSGVVQTTSQASTPLIDIPDDDLPF